MDLLLMSMKTPLLLLSLMPVAAVRETSKQGLVALLFNFFLRPSVIVHVALWELYALAFRGL